MHTNSRYVITSANSSITLPLVLVANSKEPQAIVIFKHFERTSLVMVPLIAEPFLGIVTLQNADCGV